MRAKSCWTKPASNPIHRLRVLTESADSGPNYQAAESLVRPKDDVINDHVQLLANNSSPQGGGNRAGDRIVGDQRGVNRGDDPFAHFGSLQIFLGKVRKDLANELLNRVDQSFDKYETREIKGHGSARISLLEELDKLLCLSDLACCECAMASEKSVRTDDLPWRACEPALLRAQMRRHPDPREEQSTGVRSAL